MVVVGSMPLAPSGLALAPLGISFPGLELSGPSMRSPAGILGQRPRLAPRPALPSTGLSPRAASIAWPAKRARPPAPDFSGLGLQPLGATPSAASTSNGHRTRKRLGAAPVGLSGLPDLGSASAADITDAWLKVADLMATSGKSTLSDATLRPPGTSTVSGSETNVAAAVISLAKPEVTAEVQQALRAAAATNKSGDDTQIESWLALAANNAVCVGEAELEALAEATAELPQAVPAEEVPPVPLRPPEVSSSIANQIEALLPGGNGQREEPSEKAAAAVTAAAGACVQPTQASHLSQQSEELSPALPSLAIAPADIAGNELTGIEMLKAMADIRGKEDAAGSDARPIAGYAMVSMMHRAAENAKRNMRSRMAEELLSKPPSASATKASKLSEDALLDMDEPVKLGEEQPPKEVGLLFLGNVPRGTGEGLILAECTKYGQVQSIYYETTQIDMIEGAWALVTFVAQESAAAAVKKMSKRSGLFGGTEPVEVRLGTVADTKKVEHHRAISSVQSEATDDKKPIVESLPAISSVLVQEEPPTVEQERPREEKEKKRDRRKDRSSSDDRDRRRKEKKKDKKKKARKDDRSRRRRRDSRSRSRGDDSDDSASDGGDAVTAAKAALVPATTSEKKVRGLGGFDSSPAPDSTKILNIGAVAVAPDEPSGGRQVGCRGSWAEFATPDNRSYYVNVLTGEKQWMKPEVYENNASNRAGKGTSTTGHSNLYVGGLPAGINEVAFRQLFAGFGAVISIKVVPEAYYGFVKFGRMDEAQRAVQVLNGSILAGSQLQVRFANMDRAW